MMRVPRLYLHWTPLEAESVIDFLDHLRDQLVKSYGTQIAEVHRTECTTVPTDHQQLSLDLGDDRTCTF